MCFINWPFTSKSNIHFINGNEHLLLFVGQLIKQFGVCICREIDNIIDPFIHHLHSAHTSLRGFQKQNIHHLLQVKRATIKVNRVFGVFSYLLKFVDSYQARFIGLLQIVKNLIKRSSRIRNITQSDAPRRHSTYIVCDTCLQRGDCVNKYRPYFPPARLQRIKYRLP